MGRRCDQCDRLAAVLIRLRGSKFRVNAYVPRRLTSDEIMCLRGKAVFYSLVPRPIRAVRVSGGGLKQSAITSDSESQANSPDKLNG